MYGEAKKIYVSQLYGLTNKIDFSLCPNLFSKYINRGNFEILLKLFTLI